MQQIGEVIREYADDIFAVQGILIGNWGEMHGSRYLTPDAFRTLTDTMIKAVDGACPVAVRKPAQWRELTLGWTEQELSLIHICVSSLSRIWKSRMLFIPEESISAIILEEWM